MVPKGCPPLKASAGVDAGMHAVFARTHARVGE